MRDIKAHLHLDTIFYELLYRSKIIGNRKYHHYPLFTFACKVWTEDKLVASFKNPPFNIDFHRIQINHRILYVGNFNLHMSLTKCVTSKAETSRRFLKRKSLIQCSYKDRCFFHQEEKHI